MSPEQHVTVTDQRERAADSPWTEQRAELPEWVWTSPSLLSAQGKNRTIMWRCVFSLLLNVTAANRCDVWSQQIFWVQQLKVMSHRFITVKQKAAVRVIQNLNRFFCCWFILILMSELSDSRHPVYSKPPPPPHVVTQSVSSWSVSFWCVKMFFFFLLKHSNELFGISYPTTTLCHLFTSLHVSNEGVMNNRTYCMWMDECYCVLQGGVVLQTGLCLDPPVISSLPALLPGRKPRRAAGTEEHVWWS